jgi:hypothetical protein
MLHLLLPLLFQVAADAPKDTTVITGQTPNGEKVVCKMVNETGSRTNRKRVCKTVETERGAERDRDDIKQFLTNNGNAQQPPAP